MSDIDDLFAKRLDDEADFPNRGKNWKQMSKRLDAFDAGSVQGNAPRLRGWQAATLVATLAVAGLLWKNYHTERKNRELRQELIALRQLQQPRQEAVELSPSASLKEALAQKEAVPYQASQSEPGKGNEVRDNWSQNVAVAQHKAVAPGQAVKNTNSDTGNQLQNGAAMANQAPKQDANIPEKEIRLPATFPLTQPDSFYRSNVAPAIIKDSAAQQINAPDTLQSMAALVKDSTALLPAVAQEIKPVDARKSRFRAGIQATFGFVQPKQKGVSVIQGQGITLEAKIFKSLWVTGSVDWVHHDVSTEAFVPKFHPHHDTLPKPPGWGGGGGGGGPHQSKLIMVESSPREQHFGLGLRYNFPVKCWVRPSVRIAHHWVRVSPTLITYKYEKDDPGGPGGPGQHDHETEYSAEKFEAQWLNNQWRFGVGLEKDIPNWTFGLWADYSKDFSAATPSYDALYLRAGAQYRF